MTQPGPPNGDENNAFTYRFVGDDSAVDDYLVLDFVGSEALNQPYEFVIRLACRDELVEPNELIGKKASLSIERAAYGGDHIG